MAIRSYRPQTTAPGPARAPQINVGVAGDTSGAQAIGRGISQIGEVLERGRQATELTDARLTLTEGIGAINQELADDTDFRGMSERYGERLKGLQKQVLEGLSTPGLKQRMTLDVAQARIAAEARITDRQNRLEGGHARATLARTVRAAANAIPAAENEEEARLLYQFAQTSIADLEAAEHISPEEAEEMRATFDGDVSQALVLGAINDNAATAAAQLAEPGAFGLEEVERQRYLATATRAAESEARTTRTKLERRVDTARNALVRGKKIDPEELAELRATVAGTDLEAELEAAAQASAELGRFHLARPEERAAHIAEVRSRGISLDSATIDSAQIATLEAIDAELTTAEDATLRATGQRVKEAVTALGDGREVADLEAVRQAAAGTAFADDLELAVKRKEFAEAFAKAPPAEQRRLLQDARTAGVVSSTRTADEAFLDTLESIDAEAERSLETDPVQYAIDTGMSAAAPLDFSDPESVGDRLAVARELAEEYGAEPTFFTKRERDAFKDSVENGTPEEQLGLVVSMIDGFGPAAPRAFRELDGVDPVVRRAGELVIETGSDRVAGIILKGRKAMQTGDELNVPSQDAIDVFSENLGGSLSAVPGGREGLIETAKAYYAQMAPGRVTPNDLRGQTDLLAEGLQRVLGGEMVDGQLWGGAQPVNGRLTKLPPELNTASAEELLGTATLEDFRAASLTGSGPLEGDEEVLPEGAVLQWAGGSLYRVGVQSRRGQIEWYQDSGVDNGFFYVDLSRLGQSVLEARRRGDRQPAPAVDPTASHNRAGNR
ncbi:hypothetical protein ATO8_19804 [Roseivivax marinus]|uniref:Uncharacterized protein n=1 Tax=Roseivivax marinus TaxID=1379903 RepID=W4HFH3_9RHOB|nr:hypothetical protein [Roseivivax marinus]ETW10876.1 hypothetical protein ATO8_19804 [Roseivivax marinus]